MSFAPDPMPSDNLPEDQRPQRPAPSRWDYWEWPSFIVVFMAMFGTAAFVFGGIISAINHVWWLAVVAWVVAFFNMWYWSSQ